MARYSAIFYFIEMCLMGGFFITFEGKPIANP